MTDGLSCSDATTTLAQVSVCSPHLLVGPSGFLDSIQPGFLDAGLRRPSRWDTHSQLTPSSLLSLSLSLPLLLQGLSLSSSSSGSGAPCARRRRARRGLGRSRALPSGVRPPYIRAVGSAPAFRRSSSTLAAWASTARCRGVRPHVGSCGVCQRSVTLERGQRLAHTGPPQCLTGLLRSAPASLSSRTISASLWMTATWSGVWPGDRAIVSDGEVRVLGSVLILGKGHVS